MARLIARRDSAEGYVYIGSGDRYSIPEDVWRELADGIGPYRGQWSKTTREFRLDLERGASAVNMLRNAGHRVETIDGEIGGARGPLECRECQTPYGSRLAALPPANCVHCNAPLVLVPPHVCGPECAENARQGAS